MLRALPGLEISLPHHRRDRKGAIRARGFGVHGDQEANGWKQDPSRNHEIEAAEVVEAEELQGLVYILKMVVFASALLVVA